MSQICDVVGGRYQDAACQCDFDAIPPRNIAQMEAQLSHLTCRVDELYHQLESISACLSQLCGSSRVISAVTASSVVQTDTEGVNDVTVGDGKPDGNGAVNQFLSHTVNDMHKQLDYPGGDKSIESIKNVVLQTLYKDSDDRARRARSFIISGVMELSDIDDVSFVSQLLATEFGLSYQWDEISCRRIGKRTQGKVQPILVSIPDPGDVAWITSNAKKLHRSHDSYIRTNIYISRNMSAEERRYAYEKRCLIRARRLREAAGPNSSPLQSTSRDNHAVNYQGVASVSSGENHQIRVVLNSNRKTSNRDHNRLNEHSVSRPANLIVVPVSHQTPSPEDLLSFPPLATSQLRSSPGTTISDTAISGPLIGQLPLMPSSSIGLSSVASVHSAASDNDSNGADQTVDPPTRFSSTSLSSSDLSVSVPPFVPSNCNVAHDDGNEASGMRDLGRHA